jgi:putative hemolysin
VNWPVLVQMLVLTGCSAFFSAAETALFSLEPLQIEERTAGRGPVARALRWCLDRPRAVLLTILISNLGINTYYAALAGSWMTEVGSWWPLIFVASTLWLIYFAEIIPKSLALGLSGSVASVAAPFLRIWTQVLRPITVPAGWILRYLQHRFARKPALPPVLSQEEMQELVAQRPERFGLGKRTALLIGEIVELAEVQVSELMDSLVDLPMIGPSGRVGEARRATFAGESSFIVVVEDDQVQGIVDTRSLLPAAADAAIEPLIVDIPIIPELARLQHLLELFREQRVERVLVVDEYGASVGVVSWDDLVEKLVGDLVRGEKESFEEPVRQLSERTWELAGSLGLREVEELLGVRLQRVRNRTIGGWFTEQLGRLPRTGDSVHLAGSTWIASEVQRGRVLRVTFDYVEAPQTGRERS